ncbi:MAG: MotA/TolQ/ExbB proton channel family protein [Planctomycetota bacterium]|nr:MotA/TolQ/ExbB proton channel family protein [Planctomycetota bacterium]
MPAASKLASFQLAASSVEAFQCRAESVLNGLRSHWVSNEYLRMAIRVALFAIVFAGATNSLHAQDAAPAAAAAESESMLVTTWNALGWKYAIAFLIMSFLLVAVLVMVILAVRKDTFVPADLIQGVEASLAENNLQAAAELVRADDSFLGQVVSAGLAKLQSGKPAALEAMAVTGEDETMKLEHKVGYLALIGNIAPMVGLLGTVDGMVISFGEIASSEQTPKPAKLAGGIQTALYTTLVGLVLAIPAIIAYNLLRNRIQRMVVEAGNESEKMIDQFAVALKQS